MQNSIKQIVQEMSEKELQELLRDDYLRKLGRYKLIDESFRGKYGMTYKKFERKNVVAARNFSWDVESDAQDWELALDGIKTYQKKLKALKLEHKTRKAMCSTTT